jgi:hypothetical protein
MADKATSKTERVVGFITLWIARLALATLSVAGMSHLLDAVDPMIKWPVAALSVAFLLKETL